MNDPDPLDDTGTPIPPLAPAALDSAHRLAGPGAESGLALEPPAPLRRPVVQAMNEALPVMLRRARREELPVPTPWPALNEALGGGLWPGFYTLTSGTGAGKSQWALQVALSAAQNELALFEAQQRERQDAGLPPAAAPSFPRPVIYVALELGELDLCARLLALLEAQHGARAPRWSGFAYGQAGEEQLVAAACKHQDTLQRLPLQLEVAPPQGWHAEELEQLTHLDPLPRLVVLDYLQLAAHERHEDARSAMSRVAYQARALARDYGMVVLALSSTARANYGNTRASDAVPSPWERDPGEFVGLGKESGDIEYAADGVFALLRQPNADFGPDRMHLAVAKQRAGRTRWVRLLFDGSTFTENNQAPEHAFPPPSPGPPAQTGHRFPDEE